MPTSCTPSSGHAFLFTFNSKVLAYAKLSCVTDTSDLFSLASRRLPVIEMVRIDGSPMAVTHIVPSTSFSAYVWASQLDVVLGTLSKVTTVALNKLGSPIICGSPIQAYPNTFLLFMYESIANGMLPAAVTL